MQDLWRALRTLLNLGALLLILASLTTRFVFPLVSLEGRRFWILGLAPLPRRQVVWQKLLLSVAVTALFTVALAFLSAWRLGLSPLELTLSVAATAAATVALSGLAVGLGSLYADFEQDNPARIVSGLGGTLCFLLSLAYVAAVGAAQAAVLLWEPLVAVRLGPRPAWLVPAALAWIAGASLLTTWLPLALGLRQIENAEF